MAAPLAIVVILLGAQAAAPAAAASAPAPAAPVATVLGFPPYPGALSLRYAGDLKVNGVPADALVLHTGDPQETVLAYYQEKLAGKVFPLKVHRFGAGSAYISFYDGLSRTIRVLTVMPDPAGGSMLVYSSMDPRPLYKKTQVEPPPALPKIPGAERITTTESNSRGDTSHSAHFVLPGHTEEQARAAVKDAMRAQGWKLMAGDALDKDSLVFEKESRMCIVRIGLANQDGAGGASVTMVVSQR